MDADPGSPATAQHAEASARIWRYRQDRNLSLSQLAEQAGVSKGYLSALESDSDTRRPTAETHYAIAKALGVIMSALLGRKTPPRSQHRNTHKPA